MPDGSAYHVYAGIVFSVFRNRAAKRLILRESAVYVPVGIVLRRRGFMYPPAKQTAGPSSDVQLRAKVYEESCVRSLRTLYTAQVTYWGGDAKKGFARSLKQLGPRGEDLIEQVLARH